MIDLNTLTIFKDNEKKENIDELLQADRSKMQQFTKIAIEEEPQTIRNQSIQTKEDHKISNELTVKTITHMLEFENRKFKISATVKSLEEFERIVFGKISLSNLEGRKSNIEYFDTEFNEWLVCDDLKIIPEKGKIRVTLEGIIIFLFNNDNF
jgi:hypothetical protein